MEEVTKQMLIKIYSNLGLGNGLLLRCGRSYTGFEVADELLNETEVGLDIYRSIIGLTVELLSRQKLEIK